MPEQVQSTASLLTLTASKPPRSESSRDSEGDFGAELAAAVEETDVKSAEPLTKEVAPATETQATTAETGDEAAAIKEAADAAAVKDDETAPESIEGHGEEAEMLATFVVTETIVLETAPDAVLPEDAVTSIDVEAGATYGGAPTSDTDGGSTNVIDASAIIELTLHSEGISHSVEQSQPSLLTPDVVSADDGALLTAIEAGPEAEPESVGAVLPSFEQDQLEGDAPSNLLGEEAISPVVDSPTIESSGVTEPAGELTVETDKNSSKHHDAESHEVVEPTLASATEAALAVAALPQETVSDSGEAVSTEATDRVEANGAEGSTSRDTARTESADKAVPAERPTIDPARFVSRVTRAIEFADQRGGGPVEMRLSPPELGSLQVKIQVKDGVMTAKLEVETPAARNALLDNLPALRDRLEQQQIRIDKFDVEVRDQQQQRGGDWRQHQDHRQQTEQQQQARGESRPLRQPTAPVITPVDTPAARTISFANNGINLVV
jgi:flagellar hook-length control protein FliK